MLIEVIFFLTILCLFLIPGAAYVAANYSIGWVIALAFIGLFVLDWRKAKQAEDVKK